MSIKLDENLPHRLVTSLQKLGHDVHTPYDELLAGHLDQEIWEAAQKESRFLITLDLDFSDVRHLLPARTVASSFCAFALPAENT